MEKWVWVKRVWKRTVTEENFTIVYAIPIPDQHPSRSGFIYVFHFWYDLWFLQFTTAATIAARKE